MTEYVGENVDLGEHSFIAGGDANLYSHLGNQYGRKKQKIGNQSTSRPSDTALGHILKGC